MEHRFYQKLICIIGVLLLYFIVIIDHTNVKITLVKMVETNRFKKVCYQRNLVGRVFINTTVPTTFEAIKQLNEDEAIKQLHEDEAIKQLHEDVKPGGIWKPSMCKSINQVAIIIPYKNRESQLKIFLQHYYPILKRQKLFFQIFVVEQDDSSPFNKAKLMNIGYREALYQNSNFNCFIFHDVDLLLENDNNLYNCHKSPLHLCPAVSTLNYQLYSDRLFGGVTSFTRPHFEKVNGFSNRYWGWGCEDDDMYWRLRHNHIPIMRPNLTVGRYTMINHKKEQRNGLGINILKKVEHGELNTQSDGVTTLKYRTNSLEFKSLYTNIKVDCLITKEEKELTTLAKYNQQKNY